jgi:hypothetical protein
MGVEKMSVSFDLKLGEAIRDSALRSGQSVSAWLAESAALRLRQEMLGEAIEAWERKYGKLTAEEKEAADRLLDRAAAKREGSKAQELTGKPYKPEKIREVKRQAKAA